MTAEQIVIDTIPVAVANNATVALAAAAEYGINAQNAADLGLILQDMYRNNEQAFVIEFLNTIPIVENGDAFNVLLNTAKAANSQKTSVWQLLGAALEGIGNVLSGSNQPNINNNNNNDQPPTTPPKKTFLEEYGILLLIGAIVGGLLYFGTRK